MPTLLALVTLATALVTLCVALLALRQVVRGA